MESLSTSVPRTSAGITVEECGMCTTAELPAPTTTPVVIDESISKTALVGVRTPAACAIPSGYLNNQPSDAHVSRGSHATALRLLRRKHDHRENQTRPRKGML